MSRLLPQIANVDWHLLLTTLMSYWVAPLGAVALFFYGNFHFNTPDYSIASTEGEGNKSLFKYSPMARLRATAPPKFTTARRRYRRASFQYVVMLEILFFLVTLCPDIVAYAAQIQDLKVTLSSSANERAVWALFVLTGLLSSFPGFKEIDGWLRLKLHQRAAIPDDARLTASTLFGAEFAPEDSVRKGVIESFRTAHLRKVVEKSEAGCLESEWFKVRCIMAQLESIINDVQFREFKRRFEAELDEIGQVVKYQKEKLFEFFLRQDKVLPGSTPDIDIFYEEHQHDEELKPISERREKLIFQAQAIHYRLCLYCSVLGYATNDSAEGLEILFKRLGFQVRMEQVPRVSWNAIIVVMGAVFGVILMPTLAYTMVLGAWGFQPEGNTAKFVPADFGVALKWSIVGLLLHALSLTLSSFMKRKLARARDTSSRAPRRTIAENTVVTGICFVATSMVFFFLTLAGPGLDAAVQSIPWAVLPATTAYFIGVYVDNESVGRPSSIRLTVIQAATMLVFALLISLISVPDSVDFHNWPTIIWIFAGYCGITAALIGGAIGYVFQRHYRKENTGGSIPARAVSV